MAQSIITGSGANMFYNQSGLFKPNDQQYTAPQNYSYTFSGTDARVFAYFYGLENQIVQMNSLHTISISVHEAKGQVRSLGHRGIRGMTRSVRTVAGSIIARVIREHPLAPLARMATDGTQGEDLYSRGWSIDYLENGTGSAYNIYDYRVKLGTMLAPFNLLFELTSEIGSSTIQTEQISVGGKVSSGQIAVESSKEDEAVVTGKRVFNGASMLLEDVEIIDEGITVSVNDIMTEMTFTYIAKNFRPISDNIFVASEEGGPSLRAIPLNIVRRREQDLMAALMTPSGQVRKLASGQEI